MKTTHSFDYAKTLLKTIAAHYNTEFKQASVDLWASELKHCSIEDLRKAYELLKEQYEALPWNFAVSSGLLKQLKPTMTTATVEERLYSSMRSENPYKFLEKIHPKLMKLAEEGNIFNKSLTPKDLSFNISAVAKRFIEWHQNAKKGFVSEEPETKAVETKERQGLKRVQNPLKGLQGEARRLKALEILGATKNAA